MWDKINKFQNTLLAKDDLTYDVALSTAVAMETASRDAAELQTDAKSGVHKVSSSHHTRRHQANKSSQVASCHHCLGRNHAHYECYFKNAKCDSCGKIGHIPRAFPEKNQQRHVPGVQNRQHPGKQKQKRHKKKPHNIHQMDGENSSESECYNIQINSITSNCSNIWLYPKINGREIKFELDTGSAVSIMPHNVYQQTFKDSTLSPTKIQLRTYTGEPITPLGKAKVSVKLHGQNKKMDLYVIKGGNTPLFGRSWLREIKLKWDEIHAVSAAESINNNRASPKSSTKASTKSRLDSILDRHSSVFAEGIGKLTGFQATLNVKDNTQPRFLKARNVPTLYDHRLKQN